MRPAAGHRTDRVTVTDGSFDLHVWRPERGTGPGLLLLQEIWGVGPYIRAVAVRLAGAGYVVGAPDLFWRLQPGWEADHDRAGLDASLDLMSRFDAETGVADSVAALAHLDGLTEIEGPAGVYGICLGGTVGWFVAAAVQPSVLVAYYGAGISGGLDQADRIICPTLLHFGGSDSYIPRADVEGVANVVAARPNIECHVHEGAGHAFDNHEAPDFHHPEAARAAREITERFLAEHLPAG